MLRPMFITLVANTAAGDVPGTAPAVAKSQLDSDGDGYGNRCDGDVSNTQGTNGLVNTTDYSIFRALINKVPGPSGYCGPLPAVPNVTCPPLP